MDPNDIQLESQPEDKVHEDVVEAIPPAPAAVVADPRHPLPVQPVIQPAPELPEEEKGPVMINLPIAVGIVPGLLSSSAPYMFPPKICNGLLSGNIDSGKCDFLRAITESLCDRYIIGLDFKIKDKGNVRFKMWDMAGRERHYKNRPNYYSGINFILFFGNDAVNVNEWIRYANRDNSNLQLFGLVYDRQADNTFTPRAIPCNENDLTARITHENLPMSVTRNDACIVGDALLSQVLRLITQPRMTQAPVAEQEQKRGCSLM